jgi:hypothetical protein
MRRRLPSSDRRKPHLDARPTAIALVVILGLAPPCPVCRYSLARWRPSVLPIGDDRARSTGSTSPTTRCRLLLVLWPLACALLVYPLGRWREDVRNGFVLLATGVTCSWRTALVPLVAPNT